MEEHNKELQIIRDFDIFPYITEEEALEIKSACAIVLADYYEELSESDFRKCVTILSIYQ